MKSILSLSFIFGLLLLIVDQWNVAEQQLTASTAPVGMTALADEKLDAPALLAIAWDYGSSAPDALPGGPLLALWSDASIVTSPKGELSQATAGIMNKDEFHALLEVMEEIVDECPRSALLAPDDRTVAIELRDDDTMERKLVWIPWLRIYSKNDLAILPDDICHERLQNLQDCIQDLRYTSEASVYHLMKRLDKYSPETIR